MKNEVNNVWYGLYKYMYLIIIVSNSFVGLLSNFNYY